MEIFGLLVVLGLVATLILPWVNMGRISSQRSELERLKRERWDLQSKKDAHQSVGASLVKTAATTATARSAKKAAKPEDAQSEPEPNGEVVRTSETVSTAANAEICDPGNAALPSCSTRPPPRKPSAPAEPLYFSPLVREFRKVQKNNDFFRNQGLTRSGLPSFFRRSLPN